jgi:hypothetical protein
VLTGSAVAGCEFAGLADGVGVGRGVWAPDAVVCGEWLRVTCAGALVATGKHPASATVMPIAEIQRLIPAPIRAFTLRRITVANPIFPTPESCPGARIIPQRLRP